MERVKGLEPSISAWKANVLPLHYTRLKYEIVGSRVFGLAEQDRGVVGCEENSSDNEFPVLRSKIAAPSAAKETRETK